MLMTTAPTDDVGSGSGRSLDPSRMCKRLHAAFLCSNVKLVKTPSQGYRSGFDWHVCCVVLLVH